MIDRSRIRLLAGALASLAPLSLMGCAGPGYVAAPRRYPPYYHDYYYYPHVGVYFHLHSGWYYYRDGRHWRRVRRLPPHIHLHSGQRRLLRIPEKEPWRRHAEHRRKYPPRRLFPRPAPAPDQRRLRPPPADGREAPRARPTEPRRVFPPDRRRPEREYDREERDHNVRRHDEYRRRIWPER